MSSDQTPKSSQPPKDTKKKGKFKLPKQKYLLIGLSIAVIFFAGAAIWAVTNLNDEPAENALSETQNNTQDTQEVENEEDDTPETSDESDESDNSDTEETEDGTQDSDEEDESNAESEDDGSSGEQQIAYLTEQDLWVMNIDGSDKQQLTTDGTDPDVRYTAFTWKDEDLLSYSKCDSDCKIYTIDLTDMSTTVDHTPPPFTQSIDSIAWTSDANILAYMFEKGDYSRETIVIDGSDRTSIKMYPAPVARGGSYNDELEVKFSPDDTMIISLNTLVPSTEDTFTVSNIDGTEIVSKQEAYFPCFDANDGIYYKKSGEIKRYSFSTNASATMYTFVGSTNGYDLEVSPDGNFISFWDEIAADDEINLYYHDVAGSPSLIKKQLADAKWITSEELIAMKPELPVMGMGFTSKGLEKVDRVGGSSTLISAQPIYKFEIERM